MTRGLNVRRGAAGAAGAARRRVLGLTLLEVLVAVVIVGILAAVAFPSYSAQMLKSRRAETQAYLQSVAVRQQQFLVDTRGYAALTSVGVAVPDNVANFYTLQLDLAAGPPPTYALSATPKGPQSSDACGALSINQAGTKTAAKTGCW